MTITVRLALAPLIEANTLFAAEPEHRIRALLQCAKRAGATEVAIRNDRQRLVTVADNGRPVEDFSRLFHLGDPWWNSVTDNTRVRAEFHCLAPGEVFISSGGQAVHLTQDGWRGSPIEVTADPTSTTRTRITFHDDHRAS